MSTLTPAAPQNSVPGPTALNSGSRRSRFGKFGGKSRMDPT